MNHRHALPDGRTPGTELALTDQHSDELYFAEELDIMRITTKRIHRAATHLAATGAPPHLVMGDIAKSAHDAVPELEHAIVELWEARAGRDAVTAQLADWKRELDATRG